MTNYNPIKIFNELKKYCNSINHLKESIKQKNNSLVLPEGIFCGLNGEKEFYNNKDLKIDNIHKYMKTDNYQYLLDDYADFLEDFNGFSTSALNYVKNYPISKYLRSNIPYIQFYLISFYFYNNRKNVVTENEINIFIDKEKINDKVHDYISKENCIPFYWDMKKNIIYNINGISKINNGDDIINLFSSKLFTIPYLTDDDINIENFIDDNIDRISKSNYAYPINTNGDMYHYADLYDFLNIFSSYEKYIRIVSRYESYNSNLNIIFSKNRLFCFELMIREKKEKKIMVNPAKNVIIGFMNNLKKY